MFAKKPTFTYIGEKVFEIGKHVIVTDECCSTSEFNGNIQVSFPDGYEPRLYNFNVNVGNETIPLSCERVMFSNVVPVCVKGYKHMKTGEELYPEFGIPLEKVKVK